MITPRIVRLSTAEALIALAGADQVRLVVLHQRTCSTRRTSRQVDCSCRREYRLVAVAGGER